MNAVNTHTGELDANILGVMAEKEGWGKPSSPPTWPVWYPNR